MHIPVFVSCQTVLSDEQEAIRKAILTQLREYKIDSLERLAEATTQLKHRFLKCWQLLSTVLGPTIHGFEQFRSTREIHKPGTISEATQKGVRSFPSDWNHLEAGIVLALGLPLLISRENAIRGGIFDDDVTDAFLRKMPTDPRSPGLDDVFIKWQADVRTRYYHM